ncbi:MAG: hypothetical protein ACE37J_02785 [Pikeienuella sp.]|uniref:hypothetical protein n=1 Tax=Pikeienuella sp. TaxID=2831957 RepID=UPI0039192862
MSAARLLLAAALALPPAFAAGQEAARVRAYDVGDASRVEIPLSGGGFSLERSGERQVDLVAEGAEGGFDLSEVAEGGLSRRIAGARLAPESAGTRIRFLLSCDCEYAARMSGGVLSIDFREAGAADDPEEPAPQRIAGNEGRTAPRFSAPPPRRAGPGGAPAPVAAAAPRPETRAELEEEVVIARQKLLEQLSRAAEQGLLEFSSPEAAALAPPPPDEPRRRRAEPEPEPEPEPEATPAPEPEPEPAPETALADAPPPPQPIELPVRARTAIDKEFRADRSETLVETAPCIADSRLDPQGWPDAGAFQAEQAKLSATLLDEFDNPEPGAATALARLYVAAGFGAEARRLIEIYGDAVSDPSLLADLSRIVEGGIPAADGPVHAAGPCSGFTAIWYRAAGLQPPPLSADAPEAARLRAAEIAEEMVARFGVMPVPLRVLLGPPLITDLVNRGEVDVARRIDLMLRRIPGDHGPAFDLARARLLAETAEANEAEALLARLGGRDLPESQEALILLLDSLIERRAPVPGDLAEALAEAAFMARGGPMERRLKIAEIRARARSEGFIAALETAREARERRPDSAVILQDAAHAVLEEASAVEAGPLAYVRAVLAHRDDISTDMAGDEARRRIAEELTSVGLANAALAFLDPALRRGAPGVRRAAARAHLALGDAEAALVALEGVGGAEAERLRAAAEDLAGRPEAALDRLSALGGAAPEDQAALALRAGAWAQASVAGAPERRLLAAFMAGEEAETALRPELEAAAPGAAAAFLDPPAMEGEVTLGAAESVMNASRAVREAIKEALGDG